MRPAEKRTAGSHPGGFGEATTEDNANAATGRPPHQVDGSGRRAMQRAPTGPTRDAPSFRVWVDAVRPNGVMRGKYPTQEAAEAAALRLRLNGLEARVVPVNCDVPRARMKAGR